MAINYRHIYETWCLKEKPSSTTARMTRKTLEYICMSMEKDWQSINILPPGQAINMLNASLEKAALGSQSRSNYRGYCKRFYKFLENEGLLKGSEDSIKLWPDLTSHSKNGELKIYNRFVTWAINADIWPTNVKPQSILDWALHEKSAGNTGWRRDYTNLISTWQQQHELGKLPVIKFKSLPESTNSKYGLQYDKWPCHLQDEWQSICTIATNPLRKGGVRPWREITKNQNRLKMELILGWLAKSKGLKSLEQTFSTILSADNIREYLGWLIARRGQNQLNQSHTALIRVIRGIHRFLLNSGDDIIEMFNEMAVCDVHIKDKTDKLVPYTKVKSAFESMAEDVKSMLHKDHSKKFARKAVDTIIFGLLATRGLRSLNIRSMKLGKNLKRSENGYTLHFDADEMKGHRKFETSIPETLTDIIDVYIDRLYAVLKGRNPKDGDILLVNGKGKSFSGPAFQSKVKGITKKVFGKAVNAHLFRHMLATYAAQEGKMTPREVAAILDHRSPMTTMKYYETTNSKRAAEKLDNM